LFFSLRHIARTLLTATFLLGMVLIGTQYVGLASPARVTVSQSQVVSEGRNIFGQACIQCHGIGHIMVQGKTEERWRDTVYSMISRGAQLMPDEIDPLIAYLTATYGTDSAAPAAEGATSGGSATLPDESGRVILDRTCTGCHALQLVTSSRKSRAEWQDTISRMISFGVELTDDERQTVEDYAAEHFGTQ